MTVSINSVSEISDFFSANVKENAVGEVKYQGRNYSYVCKEFLILSEYYLELLDFQETSKTILFANRFFKNIPGTFSNTSESDIFLCSEGTMGVENDLDSFCANRIRHLNFLKVIHLKPIAQTRNPLVSFLSKIIPDKALT